jgi:hypothetical protein
MLQPIQPEAILEQNLDTQLRGMGYELVEQPEKPVSFQKLQYQYNNEYGFICRLFSESSCF